ncbi:MAG: hypothetical protein GDA49_09320 [Rhodospirillales bacterium]|nr:hypothetical protein [Rhodospirillales bacterium]
MGMTAGDIAIGPVDFDLQEIGRAEDGARSRTARGRDTEGVAHDLKAALGQFQTPDPFREGCEHRGTINLTGGMPFPVGRDDVLKGRRSRGSTTSGLGATL